MAYLNAYLIELWVLLLDMSPWLMLGFLIAGILHVYFPAGKISSVLGSSNSKSVLRAALIGIPLPLCSCGVIPTGVSMYKNGASKGSSISFLISTPQTGVDSIMVTYSMLGLPFAIIRPVIALITGVAGGFITNFSEKKSDKKFENKPSIGKVITTTKPGFLSIFNYGFYYFMKDIAKWLTIGLLIAALIALLVPDDFFSQYIANDYLGMLIILSVSVPFYVCATSSVPLAAVLLMKGLSPGAAIVFLMAGPATNAATIAVIGNSMGKKTLFIYLATIIGGALLSGIFVNEFLPREWFTIDSANHHLNHDHGLLPYWLHISSAVLLLALLINIFMRKWFVKPKPIAKPAAFNFSNLSMVALTEHKISVKGMTCSHCVKSVESNISKLSGVDYVKADLDSQTVLIRAKQINLQEVKKTVEELGYKYRGEI